MTIDEVVQILNASQPKPLTKLQEWLLRCCWEGKTYSSMALEANYVEEYLRRTASGLWSLLSDFWGEPITKSNFRSTLEPRRLKRAEQQFVENLNRSMAVTPPDFPSGPLSLDSKFYIPRPPIEELVCEEIAKPGSVIRIKAPWKLGKSSLMLRVIAHAAALNYSNASVDFQQAESLVFTSLDKFLRWFSANVSRELHIESKLNDYWDENIGSKVSCTIYFQNYLLASHLNPIVLSLTELNQIFYYPQIARDFFSLLRFWHEQAKHEESWKKLRIVGTYSTETYIPLNLNQSPFNIGLSLKLPPFTIEQVQELAQRYGLDWTDGVRAKRLMAMVGGHPHLLQLAFYHLRRGEMTLRQLLEGAATLSGIYSDRLRQLLTLLREDPQLTAAFKQTLAAEKPVQLDPIVVHKLDSLGLVNLEGDRVTISCELYRIYFRKQLFEGENLREEMAAIASPTDPSLVESENPDLQQVFNVDEVTGLFNRRYFNHYLQTEWQRWADVGATLSLIVGEIDYFKTYNDFYGVLAGDKCLHQIASAIATTYSDRGGVQEESGLVARYGGDEFAVFLLQTDAERAMQIAEEIRKRVKDLAIVTNNIELKIDGFPDDVVTISLGVATISADAKRNADTLVRAAERSLYQSKRNGRDRVTFISLLEDNSR